MYHWQWWILTQNSRNLFLCQYCNVIAKIVLPCDNPLFIVSNINWKQLIIAYLKNANDFVQINKKRNKKKKNKHKHEKQTRLIIDCYKLPSVEKHESFIFDNQRNDINHHNHNKHGISNVYDSQFRSNKYRFKHIIYY